VQCTKSFKKEEKKLLFSSRKKNTYPHITYQQIFFYIFVFWIFSKIKETTKNNNNYIYLKNPKLPKMSLFFGIK